VIEFLDDLPGDGHDLAAPAAGEVPLGWIRGAGPMVQN
jgi:hypothetical protein